MREQQTGLQQFGGKQDQKLTNFSMDVTEKQGILGIWMVVFEADDANS